MKQENRWQRLVWSMMFCAGCLSVILAPQAYTQEGKAKVRIAIPSASIEEVADAQIAREVAKELGYKVE